MPLQNPAARVEVSHGNVRAFRTTCTQREHLQTDFLAQRRFRRCRHARPARLLDMFPAGTADLDHVMVSRARRIGCSLRTVLFSWRDRCSRARYRSGHRCCDGVPVECSGCRPYDQAISGLAGSLCDPHPCIQRARLLDSFQVAAQWRSRSHSNPHERKLAR